MPSYEKKKVSKSLLFMGGLLAAAIGYYVNGAWHKGIEIKEFYENLMTELSYPLRDYYNETTIKAVAISLLIYAVLMLMYYSSRHNLMPGKEYGTARFATIKEINKNLGAKKIKVKYVYRIISENIRFNLNQNGVMFNSNVLIIGGSGGGKTFTWVFPNMIEAGTSFIVTDPKGEIHRIMAWFLRLRGYRVRVLNLINMAKSNGYNPLAYIEKAEDILKLVKTIIASTNPPNANTGEPFWIHAEEMFLLSIFFYVWLVCSPKERTMRTVLRLIRAAEVREDGEPSELDLIMEDLAATDPLGKEHPAYVYYSMSMKGAPDTIRSIVISANARFARFNNEAVLSIFDHDEMGLKEMGIGVNGDKKTKTALFCLISDADPTYNFIASMLYSQAFQILYDTADQDYGGTLPIHVCFMLDEFANVQMPENFCKLISTMRSRAISSVVIIQNLAQLKAMYKDQWENITGNCDTTVYLGGNEESTWEYMSKLLGKTTIEKKNYGRSKGSHGSDSENYDVMQRDLMTSDEIGRLPNTKCIVKVRGMNAIIDDKFRTKNHPLFEEIFCTAHDEMLPVTKNRDTTVKPFEVLNADSVAYFTKKADSESSDQVFVDSMTLSEFLSMDESSFRDRILDRTDMDEIQKAHERTGLPSSLQYMPEGDRHYDEDEEDEDDPELDLVRRLIREAKERVREKEAQPAKDAFIPSKKASSTQ